MEAASWPRTVEVLGAGGGCGSGTLIAPGLVLTALHVVTEADGRPPELGGRIRVRVLRNRQQHSVEVVWVGDRDLDAVLLRGDPHRLGRDLAPVRWGELTCSSPKVDAECSAVGFPRAARFGAVHDSRLVLGHVSPATGLNAAKYDVDVSNAVPDDADGGSGWSGLSGAGLFCNEILIGLVEAVPDLWRGRTLWALPVRRLLALEDFKTALTAFAGISPQLESADQGPLFHAPPVPHLSPSYLLSPQAEVVPFMGMVEEIADLTSWCTSRRVVDVAVAFGPGGVGKTRLATELIRRMTERRSPWTAGFLSDVPHAGVSLESLTTNIRPLLLVLDYAETRVEQVEEVLRLFSGARHAHDPVRILLLARTVHRWWKDLQVGWQGTTVMERGTVVQLTPASTHSRMGSERSFGLATHAFRERIEHLISLEGVPETGGFESLAKEPASGTDLADPPDELVVSVHMAALAKVLEDVTVPSAASAVRPVDVLLAHESRYWRHSARSHGLDGLFRKQQDLLRQLVAVQRILGATERRDALHAVMAAFRFHDRDFDTPQPPDRDNVRRIELMLADLYPATDGARWGAMSPDVLAAELIVQADREGDSELVAHILPDTALSVAQQHRAMSVLARATTHQPTLTDSVARGVAAAPDVLLTTALDVATGLAPRDAATWLTALKPVATSRVSAGEHDAADQLQRLDDLLDEITSGFGARIQPAEPEPTDPELVEPEPTGPESVEPEPTRPESVEPQPTGPEVAELEPMGPEPPSPEPPADLVLLLPPRAHLGAREPITARFHFASGAVIDQERQQRMDQALQCLTEEARRSNQLLPAVSTIHLGLDNSVELHLSTAAPAIEPFRANGSGRVWRCSSDQVLPADIDMGALTHAYPALVHLGWELNGAITLVDLEHVGLVHLKGAAAHVHPMLGELAFELTHRSHANGPHLHVTGVPGNLCHLADGTLHNTVEDAIDNVRAHAAQVRSALHALGFEHPRDARMHDPLNDLWKPQIILAGHTMVGDTARELGRILDARPQTGLGIVARAPSGSHGLAERWTVILDP
ncbi:trypsin-like serine protease [Streptomyces sp. NPDC001389]|uniref:trypsin-like serine protease n=1 Tax=Streptomyces sp. NPDC001389 TaxID=3364569 RepID=UPI0036A808AB